MSDFDLSEDATPDEILEAMADGLEAEMGEVQTARLAGYPSVLADVSGSADDTPFEGTLAIVIVEERLVAVFGLGKVGQWAALRPVYIDMVNSLSFFEPS